jgi:hypothetical protein
MGALNNRFQYVRQRKKGPSGADLNKVMIRVKMKRRGEGLLGDRERAGTTAGWGFDTQQISCFRPRRQW